MCYEVKCFYADGSIQNTVVATIEIAELLSRILLVDESVVFVCIYNK